MFSPNDIRRCRRTMAYFRRADQAFTLVELLVVIGIMVILASFMAPAFNALGGAGTLTKSVSDISSVLEQARSYAMGKNTYVYVGIQELDMITPTNSGIGRVAIAAVASKDGTRPYGNTPAPLTNNILQIAKALYFDNLHLTNAGSLVGNSKLTGTNNAMLIRPGGSASTVSSNSVVDLSGTTSQTTFTFPLTGAVKYNFTQVIEFDPQGVARVQKAVVFDPSINNYLEIPLIPTHGNTAPNVPKDQAAIQINGVTGAVRIYRP